MAKIEFDLIDGVEVGGQLEKHVVLAELTVKDVIECSMESERIEQGPKGPVLVSSPSLTGALSICRQVKQLGSIQGPIDITVLGKLTETDFVLLQAKSEELVSAVDSSIEAMSERGRSAGGGEES